MEQNFEYLIVLFHVEHNFYGPYNKTKWKKKKKDKAIIHLVFYNVFLLHLKHTPNKIMCQ